jgi:hypothetical protein
MQELRDGGHLRVHHNRSGEISREFNDTVVFVAALAMSRWRMIERPIEKGHHVKLVSQQSKKGGKCKRIEKWWKKRAMTRAP